MIVAPYYICSSSNFSHVNFSNFIADLTTRLINNNFHDDFNDRRKSKETRQFLKCELVFFIIQRRTVFKRWNRKYIRVIE